MVIKNAISREQAEETAAFLWTFEEKKPKDPSTWYTAPRAEIQMKELASTGMVEVYNISIYGTIANLKRSMMLLWMYGVRKSFG